MESMIEFDNRLDGVFLQELYGGDAAYAAMIFGTFLEESGEMMDNCQTAIGAGDVPGFRRAVHKLKPTLHYVGLTHLGGVLEQIEHDCGSANVDSLHDRYTQAAAAIQAMLPVIRTQKEKLEAITINTH
jgi:HPt (histidine-containing phosphotransfer) domain-containing protein